MTDMTPKKGLSVILKGTNAYNVDGKWKGE